MDYIRLGHANSRKEEALVAENVQQGRCSKRWAAEYALDREGMAQVRSAWISTGEAGVFVFTGRSEDEEPTRAGGVRIFAAVELDMSGRPATLLKITGDYDGGPRAFGDLETMERYRKGVRIK